MKLTEPGFLDFKAAVHYDKLRKEDGFTVAGEDFKTHEIANELEEGMDDDDKKTMQHLYDNGQLDDLFKACRPLCGSKEEAMEMVKSKIHEISNGRDYKDVKAELEKGDTGEDSFNDIQ